MSLSYVFEARLTKYRFVHPYKIECGEQLQLLSVFDLDREDKVPTELISAALSAGWLNDLESRFWRKWLGSPEDWRTHVVETTQRYAQQFTQNHLTLEWSDPSEVEKIRIGASIRLRLTDASSGRSKIIEEGSISRLLQHA